MLFRPRWLIITFVTLVILGFADASFLTAEHVRGTIPPCSVVNGCERVLTSPYATVAAIPVSVLGMLYYGTLLVLLLAYLDTTRPRILEIACWFSLVGLGASLYFIYVQAFILEAYCFYCLVSATISGLIFATAARIEIINRKKNVA